MIDFFSFFPFFLFSFFFGFLFQQQQVELKNLLQQIKNQNLDDKSYSNYFLVGVALLKILPDGFDREKQVSVEEMAQFLHIRECFDEVDHLFDVFFNRYAKQESFQPPESHKNLIASLFELAIKKESNKILSEMISVFWNANK
jgi:hypothetical protein